MRQSAMFKPAATMRLVCALALAVGSLALDMSFGRAAAQTSQGAIIPLPEAELGTAPLVGSVVDVTERFTEARRGSAAQQGEAAVPRNWISPIRLQNLRHRVNHGIVRISGEREVLDFDLYSSAAAPSQVFRLKAVSGINNLPERSHVRVSVNGTAIGMRNLTHIEAPGALDFALPPDLLVEGRNHVQIEMRQHHRIFCGPEASFDLWTDLDLSRSGLVIPRGDGIPGIETFTMGLAAQASGIGPVEIRGLNALGNDAETWRAFLVSRLNQVLSGAPVVFRFSDYWSTVEQGPAKARITILPAAESRVRFVTSGDGAQVMVLEVAQGTDPADLLAGLPQLAERRDMRRVPVVEPGEDVSFSTLGFATEQLSQHYAARALDFSLPDDWLIRTAAKARVYLDYAYAPNLPEGSMLLLSMNGTSIRLLPLRGEGGVPITAFPIDFEARLMHPGPNVLTMQMFIPGDPPDLPCASNAAPMLQIGAESRLRVPYSPPMATPDMHFAFAALQPDSLRLNELSGRAYSDMDVLTLGAALSRPHAGNGVSRLHLLAIEDLGAVPTAHYRIDRRLLEQTVLSGQTDDMMLAAPVGSLDDPFQARRPSSRSFGAAVSNGWDEARARARWVRDRMFPSSGDQLSHWLADQHGQAVLFQLDPERPDEIWMLRNPDSEIHQIAQSFAAANMGGVGPRGQVAVLTHEGYWVNWLAPDRFPVLLEPWSFRNFRVAMGNIVSSRPIFYTILMLTIALVSGLVALRLVISTREHKV